MESCKLEKGGKKKKGKYMYNVDPMFDRVQVLFVNFGTLLLLLSTFFFTKKILLHKIRG